MVVALPSAPAHGMSACPACSAAPAAEEMVARVPVPDGRLALSLPTIHCAACIAAVEDSLSRIEGVKSARVNLTLKRATVDAAPEVTAQTLVSALESAGYEAHELDAATLNTTQADKAGRELLMRLAVAGFASMNVMLLSVAVWAGAADATRDMFHWISAAITLPTIAFAGQPFFRSAWGALRARRLNMDVPIVLAILLALATSLWETSLSGEHAYFDAALTLTFFLLAGRYLDHRTRAVARSAAEELAALEVPRATILIDGELQEVATSKLQIGDIILLRAGARMPVDGVITEGRSELDRALLTGESLPVLAGIGQKVSAGEVNLSSPLHIRATAVGEDTSLHQMAELVAIAESGRSRYTSLADAAAKLYAPGVHILSALSFLGWLLYSGDMRTALNIAAAVLIITCPCALGLAVPAVTTAASGRLFRAGLLVKHETALERLAQVDTVVFDKTGTLTSGTPVLSNLADIPDDMLQLAAGLAQGSEHPLSKAVVQAAATAGLEPATVEGVCELAGCGTQAMWQGQKLRFGRASWVGAGDSQSFDLQDSSQMQAWLKLGQGIPLQFSFSDNLRDGAAEAVQALKEAGKAVYLVSGDRPASVAHVARQLGIENWQAEALPAEKAAFVNGLAEAGHKTLMVGDGLNDTAALSAAHVSVSPASALDAARVASDIVLLGGDLRPISAALATAGSAVARIKENFRIATLYNIVAVPLAICGLATPLIAALAMSSSSITVSLNALRLKG